MRTPPVSAICVITLALTLATPVSAQRKSSEDLKLPAYKRVKLQNGMTVLLMEHHELPLVSFRAVLRAGAATDPLGKEGVGSVTATLLRKGTKTRTAEQLSEELDFMGGQLEVAALADSCNLSAEFVSKDVAKGLALVADVLMHPIFPQDEVTKLLKQELDSIKSAKDEPAAVIGQYFNRFLFGSHPYGRPSRGDEKSLASITREDVATFHATHYVPANTIIAAVGDFRTMEMERILSDQFGAWPAKAVAISRVTEPTVAQGPRLLLVDKPDATQTFFQVGSLGIARTNPDRVGIDLVNTVFGGRFTSWINSELRIKAGLTYAARSSFDRRMVRGPFFIESFTPNKSTEQALDLTLTTLKRLHEQGISTEELTSAKAYIKGQFPPTIETTDRLASTVAELELFGLDEGEVNALYAKVDAITLADASRIVAKYFPSEGLVFAIIGKASDIEPILRKYAKTVEKKSITEIGF